MCMRRRRNDTGMVNFAATFQEVDGFYAVHIYGAVIKFVFIRDPLCDDVCLHAGGVSGMIPGIAAHEVRDLRALRRQRVGPGNATGMSKSVFLSVGVGNPPTPERSYPNIQ